MPDRGRPVRRIARVAGLPGPQRAGGPAGSRLASVRRPRLGCCVSGRSDAHPVGPRGHPAVPPVGGGPAAQPAVEADQRVLRHRERAGERCRTAGCRPDHGSAAGLRGSGRWRISQANQHDADGGLPGQLGRC